LAPEYGYTPPQLKAQLGSLFRRCQEIEHVPAHKLCTLVGQWNIPSRSLREQLAAKLGAPVPPAVPVEQITDEVAA
jgi:hypothetical protein